MADFDTTRAANQPANEEEKPGDICRTALLRYQRFIERERQNIDNAYEDLEFVWDDKQWEQAVVAERRAEGRPILTVNRLPQFVHQVTGDMRQMRPGIKVVPVDSAGDKDVADTIRGMIRYIENRSDALSIYTRGADSQVSCGIGAWRVVTEYAADTTLNQECRIVGVDDAVAIAWDPDAILPCKEDAQWWIVPVDMSRERFKETWPKFPVEDFDVLSSPTGTAMNVYGGWFDKDMVRVAEYWVKKKIKRTVAIKPGGAVCDLTNKSEEEARQIRAESIKVEKRDSYKVVRYLITAAHVLETTDWPGMHIPLIPVVGEEIRIGRKVVRRGLIRAAKDPQKMFNYFCSAQAETVALQPKAPFMVTRTNIEQHQADWAVANKKNQPYLVYEPDSQNGGQAPQRIAPPVRSEGITEGITLAAENMKAVIGIYDAGLGAKSNETSGKAIMARQREGDTGSFVYIDNWTRAIRRTGAILIDLFPHIYDTERMIRIMGEDGKIDLVQINSPTGVEAVNEKTGKLESISKVENDITVGAYDVVLETGPSYATKREEARDSMIEFLRNAPSVAPAVIDLIAKSQDWPMADEFTERLEAIAPPAVQKMLAKDKAERGDVEPPSPPTPQEELQMRAMAAEVAQKEAEVAKTQAEAAKIAQEAGQGGGQSVDPVAAAKAVGEQQRQQIEADTAMVEMKMKQSQAAHEERMREIELEIKLVELAIKKAGAQIDTASAVQEMQAKDQGMVQDAENHAAQLMRDDEAHAVDLETKRAKSADNDRRSST